MNSKSSLLSTVPFSSFSQWDVKQFFFTKILSKYPLEELGKHLIHQTKKVQLSDEPSKEFTILGVSNKIGMFDASIEKGNKIKQKYHIVKDNWLAYNPYRINVGSIGIKTPNLKGGYISPAYVVFSCKDTILPEYLWLMMKSAFFNKLIKDSTTGSVRQTLHFEKLASIKAPIPSVIVQQQILDAYHAKLDEADENIRKGNNYSNGLLLSVQADVSDLKNKTTKNTASSSILQIIPFTSTIRWEVDYIQKKGRLETIYNSFKYQEYCINDLQKESLFGLSVKASLDKKNGMIPVLRMSNVINGELDFSTLKYLPADCTSTEKEPQKWILRKGDFLITRTNGSKDLIGKAAIFNSDETYTYASYLIRYRFDTTIVLPEYVNILAGLLLALLTVIFVMKIQSMPTAFGLSVTISAFYVMFAYELMRFKYYWIKIVSPLSIVLFAFILAVIVKYLIKSRDFDTQYKLATTDGLTELYNHRYFQEQMQRFASHSDRYNTVFSLIIIDIDFFKKFNDNFGHQSGDAVLRQVAFALKKNVRATDIVCRYGGEEMSIILPNTKNEEAVAIANKLCTIIGTKKCKLANGKESNVTISLGVSTYGEEDGLTPTELIASADKRLYHAKENGRNRVN